mmetsp:Transcript_6411/g.14784  ORF Transcript_6411/g.14784 Transcript_6411/m.14784 type:complete len:215 (-) Transcript_6411:2018-2662(-)
MVHNSLDDDGALHLTGPTDKRTNGGVGEDRDGRDLDVLNVVTLVEGVDESTTDESVGLQPPPGVAVARYFKSGNGPIFREAHFVLGINIHPSTGHAHVGIAGGSDLHRSSENVGSYSSRSGSWHVAESLGPKCTSDTLLNNANFALGQPHNLADHRVREAGSLGLDVARELLVFRRHHIGRVRLHVEVLLLVTGDCALHLPGRRRQRCGHVTAL